jgi:putative phosphoesterase
MRIGLISDTHGLLRPEALAALDGCERIIHAGDIGTAEVLERLAAVAPVTAVRGNNDTAPWARQLPAEAVLEVAGLSILVLHDAAALAGRATPGHEVVVAGHSHRPSVERRDGVLHVNPGSAGPRRLRLPVSVGFLLVSGDEVAARVEELAVAREAGGPRRKTLHSSANASGSSR